MLDTTLALNLRACVDSLDLVQMLRERVGLTQRMIAKATGTSERTVRTWEKNARPRQAAYDKLMDLAEVVALLSETLTCRGIEQWLNARNRAAEGDRPIEMIGAGEAGNVCELAVALVEGSYA